MRLIQYDKSVAQSPPTHVGEWRQFDDVALHQSDNPVEPKHLVKRVVQGSQIRIDLLPNVARQKAQPLAGLDCRAHQNDALDLLIRQRLNRTGHRKKGLAGTGWPDTKIDIVFEYVIEVTLLAGAPATDQNLTYAYYDVVWALATLELIVRDVRYRHVHPVWAQSAGDAGIGI